MHKNDDNRTLKQVAKKRSNLFWRIFKRNNTDEIDLEYLQPPSMLVLRKFLKNKLGVVGVVGLLLMLLLSFVGSVFFPLNETYIELSHANLRPGTNYLDYPKELASKNIVKISSGVSFSAAVTDKGEFYLWGTEPNKEQENVSGHIFDIPKEVRENKIVNVACGGNHIFVVDDKGNFYGWGYNGNGQTEMPDNIRDVFASGEVEVAQMEAKSSWTAVLGTDGELYLWGSTQAKTLFLISSRLQGNIAEFAGGDNNIVLLLNDGTVEVIGDRGTEFSANLPEELTDGSVKITDIAASNKNVLAVDEHGKLYTWGSSQDDLLKMPIIESDIADVSAGYRNLLAVCESGEIIIWGNDEYSQTNLPTNTENTQTIYSDYYQFYSISDKGEISAFGNDGFLLGTDHFGRDIFTRILHGGKISLSVGVVAVVISVIIALFVGLASGYFGGMIDHVLMRITDVFSSIPFYPIAITLSYAVGHEMSQTGKLYLIMVILGLLGWMPLARLVRAQLLLEREKDFVTAARALGIQSTAIMWRHILPNIMGLVIVNITLSYASSLLSEAALSFLGFGVAEPTPSWGNMLTSAQEISVIEFYPWRWLIPALFVLITALCANLIGDALREALDPRTDER